MFEVGKNVICIETHPEFARNAVKKGKVYEVTAVRKSICRCNEVDICIGIKATNAIGICRKCNIEWVNDKEWWFDSSRFAPIEPAELSELTDMDILYEPETATA